MYCENNINMSSGSTEGRATPHFMEEKFELVFFLGCALPEADSETRIWELILGSMGKEKGKESGEYRKPILCVEGAIRAQFHRGLLGDSEACTSLLVHL